MTEGSQRGSKAAQLIGVRWEDHWAASLEEFQAAHGLTGWCDARHRAAVSRFEITGALV